MNLLRYVSAINVLIFNLDKSIVRGIMEFLLLLRLFVDKRGSSNKSLGEFERKTRVCRRDSDTLDTSILRPSLGLFRDIFRFGGCVVGDLAVVLRNHIDGRETRTHIRRAHDDTAGNRGEERKRVFVRGTKKSDEIREGGREVANSLLGETSPFYVDSRSSGKYCR